MAELLGVDYVIQHIINCHNAEMQERIYRSYTADMLMTLAEAWGATVSYRYADLIDTEPPDDRTGDEVALEVIERAGLRTEHELTEDDGDTWP